MRQPTKRTHSVKQILEQEQHNKNGRLKGLLQGLMKPVLQSVFGMNKNRVGVQRQSHRIDDGHLNSKQWDIKQSKDEQKVMKRCRKVMNWKQFDDEYSHQNTERDETSHQQSSIIKQQNPQIPSHYNSQFIEMQLNKPIKRQPFCHSLELGSQVKIIKSQQKLGKSIRSVKVQDIRPKCKDIQRQDFDQKYDKIVKKVKRYSNVGTQQIQKPVEYGQFISQNFKHVFDMKNKVKYQKRQAKVRHFNKVQPRRQRIQLGFPNDNKEKFNVKRIMHQLLLQEQNKKQELRKQQAQEIRQKERVENQRQKLNQKQEPNPKQEPNIIQLNRQQFQQIHPVKGYSQQQTIPQINLIPNSNNVLDGEMFKQPRNRLNDNQEKSQLSVQFSEVPEHSNNRSQVRGNELNQSIQTQSVAPNLSAQFQQGSVKQSADKKEEFKSPERINPFKKSASGSNFKLDQIICNNHYIGDNKPVTAIQEPSLLFNFNTPEKQKNYFTGGNAVNGGNGGNGGNGENGGNGGNGVNLQFNRMCNEQAPPKVQEGINSFINNNRPINTLQGFGSTQYFGKQNMASNSASVMNGQNGYGVGVGFLQNAVPSFIKNDGSGIGVSFGSSITEVNKFMQSPEAPSQQTSLFSNQVGHVNKPIRNKSRQYKKNQCRIK